MSFQSALPAYEDTRTSLPVACRFVSSDQWLVSHVDASWKIRDVKHWFLRKCNASAPGAPQPPKFRPSSPVTFSGSRRSSVDSASDLYAPQSDDDDDDDDTAIFAYTVPGEAYQKDITLAAKRSVGYQSTTHFGDSGRVDDFSHQYVLYSFSNGHLLEDDFELSFYRLRPYELLEIQRLGALAMLPRCSPSLYIQPYFDSPVQVLHCYTGRETTTRERKLKQSRNANQPSNSAIEWKQRWLIIRQGMLSLCTAHTDNSPTEQFPISNLCALLGAEHVHTEGAVPPRTVCAKFRSSRRAPTIRKTKPPTKDTRRPPARTPSMTSSSGSVASDSVEEEPDGVDESDAKGTWVIMDMPDDRSYSNVLRVLHRLFPEPIASSFIPNLTSPITPTPTPLIQPIIPTSPVPQHPFTLDFAIPYPSWRKSVVNRSLRAGLGDVSPPMAHFLWGAEADMESPHPRGWRKNSPLNPTDLLRTGGISTAWADDDDEDRESENEWEGWVTDLTHQVRRSASGSTTFSSSGSSIASSPTDVGCTAPQSPRSRTLSFAPDVRIVSSTITVAPAPPKAVRSRAGITRSRSSTVSAIVKPTLTRADSWAATTSCATSSKSKLTVADRTTVSKGKDKDKDKDKDKNKEKTFVLHQPRSTPTMSTAPTSTSGAALKSPPNSSYLRHANSTSSISLDREIERRPLVTSMNPVNRLVRNVSMRSVAALQANSGEERLLRGLDAALDALGSVVL